MATVPVVAI